MDTTPNNNILVLLHLWITRYQRNKQVVNLVHINFTNKISN